MPKPSPKGFAWIFGPQPVRAGVGVLSARKYDRNRDVTVWPANAGSMDLISVGSMTGCDWISKSVHVAWRSFRSPPSSSQPTTTLPLRAMATPMLSVELLLMSAPFAVLTYTVSPVGCTPLLSGAPGTAWPSRLQEPRQSPAKGKASRSRNLSVDRFMMRICSVDAAAHEAARTPIMEHGSCHARHADCPWGSVLVVLRPRPPIQPRTRNICCPGAWQITRTAKTMQGHGVEGSP